MDFYVEDDSIENRRKINIVALNIPDDEIVPKTGRGRRNRDATGAGAASESASASKPMSGGRPESPQSRQSPYASDSEFRFPPAPPLPPGPSFGSVEDNNKDSSEEEKPIYTRGNSKNNRTASSSRSDRTKRQKSGKYIRKEKEDQKGVSSQSPPGQRQDKGVTKDKESAVEAMRKLLSESQEKKREENERHLPDFNQFREEHEDEFLADYSSPMGKNEATDPAYQIEREIRMAQIAKRENSARTTGRRGHMQKPDFKKTEKADIAESLVDKRIWEETEDKLLKQGDLRESLVDEMPWIDEERSGDNGARKNKAGNREKYSSKERPNPYSKANKSVATRKDRGSSRKDKSKSKQHVKGVKNRDTSRDARPLSSDEGLTAEQKREKNRTERNKLVEQLAPYKDTKDKERLRKALASIGESEFPTKVSDSIKIQSWKRDSSGRLLRDDDPRSQNSATDEECLKLGLNPALPRVPLERKVRKIEEGIDSKLTKAGSPENPAKYGQDDESLDSSDKGERLMSSDGSGKSDKGPRNTGEYRRDDERIDPSDDEKKSTSSVGSRRSGVHCESVDESESVKSGDSLKAERSEQSEKPGKSGKSGKSGRSGRSEQSGRSEGSGRSGRSGRSGSWGRLGRSGRSGSSDKSSKSSQADLYSKQTTMSPVQKPLPMPKRPDWKSGSSRKDKESKKLAKSKSTESMNMDSPKPKFERSRSGLSRSSSRHGSEISKSPSKGEILVVDGEQFRRKKITGQRLLSRKRSSRSKDFNRVSKDEVRQVNESDSEKNNEEGAHHEGPGSGRRRKGIGHGVKDALKRVFK